MSDRQTGRTTRQMREAPRGALYVWRNSRLSYPRDLARHLGRDDLDIVAPESVLRRVRGRPQMPAITVDHAAELSVEQWGVVEWAWARARP